MTTTMAVPRHPSTPANTPGLSDYKLLRLQKIFSGILWGKVDGPAWDYVALPARIVIAAGSNEKHLQKKAANANTRRNNNATHAKKIMELPLGLLLLLRYYYYYSIVFHAHYFVANSQLPTPKQSYRTMEEDTRYYSKLPILYYQIIWHPTTYTPTTWIRMENIYKSSCVIGGNRETIHCNNIPSRSTRVETKEHHY